MQQQSALPSTVSLQMPCLSASLYLSQASALFSQLAVSNHLTVCCCCVCCAGDLVGLVAETLEGLPIITAFGQNKYFVATAANKIDEHHRALFNGESLNLWLAFYCDLYGAILVLAVCIFAVTQRVQLGAAAVGLAFSNTIQVRRPASCSSNGECSSLVSSCWQPLTARFQQQCCS
jgi:ABC-type multidrug transport system fused ATPase/permease subunit